MSVLVKMGDITFAFVLPIVVHLCTLFCVAFVIIFAWILLSASTMVQWTAGMCSSSFEMAKKILLVFETPIAFFTEGWRPRAVDSIGLIRIEWTDWIGSGCGGSLVILPIEDKRARWVGYGLGNLTISD